MRLEAVTECEHGRSEEHDIWDTQPWTAYGTTSKHVGVCPGGSRREASTTDLIEELKTRGAVVEEAYVLEGFTRVDVVGLGPWLTFRLEESL